MLVNGIPAFRVDKAVVNSEIEVLREMGVEFRCGVEVGRDVTIQQLRMKATRLSMWPLAFRKPPHWASRASSSRALQAGLISWRRVNAGEAVQLKGDTIVIGGGNAAIDVARTALRKGKGKVQMFCLEKDEDMPTVPEEKNAGLEDGVVINNCWGPKRIIGEKGKVTGVEFMRCVSVKDEDGKFNPVYDENETLTVPCSNVLGGHRQRSDYGRFLPEQRRRRLTAG